MENELKEKILSLSVLCHSTNKAFCESIGDNSQVDWSEASDEVKAKMIDKVINYISYNDKYNVETTTQEDKSKEAIFRSICDFYRAK